MRGKDNFQLVKYKRLLSILYCQECLKKTFYRLLFWGLRTTTGLDVNYSCGSKAVGHAFRKYGDSVVN